MEVVGIDVTGIERDAVVIEALIVRFAGGPNAPAGPERETVAGGASGSALVVGNGAL